MPRGEREWPDLFPDDGEYREWDDEEIADEPHPTPGRLIGQLREYAETDMYTWQDIRVDAELDPILRVRVAREWDHGDPGDEHQPRRPYLRPALDRAATRFKGELMAAGFTGSVTNGPAPVTQTVTGSSLGHLPAGEKWAFDAGVTNVFGDMLARSIPQYAVMRDLTLRLGQRYVVPGTTIMDLGCSDGQALEPFVEKFGAHNTYMGLEISDPMIAQAQQRFRAWRQSGLVSIVKYDLREGVPRRAVSLMLGVLTLMFTPITYRASLIQDVYDTLLPGGAFILVEKLVGETAALDKVLVEEYHDLKARNGYTQEEIERKRLALEGVQVPITARWNEDLLHAAGFRKVELVWRYLSFGMWLAVK
jgi:tRNA (cmo5U34)-methyltransferase